MRVIHTSDWHLGQRFFGESREREQSLFLEWLLEEVIDDESVDLLIVSGDIFDIATPPSYARKLYNNFLAKASKSRCGAVVVVGGNHDSPSVLNEQKMLLRGLNIFVVGGYENPKDVLFPIESRQGNLKGIVGAVAYLRENDLRETKSLSDARSRAKELQNSISNYYKEVFQESLKLQGGRKRVPTIATGHLSTLKTVPSDSVREIYIGSLKTFDKSLFPDFDYIALGHYHRSVSMKNICYSGSPIPLSFDEIERKKVVLDVEVSIDKEVKIKEIDVPTFRRLHRFNGDFDSLKDKIISVKVDSPITPELVEIELIFGGLRNVAEVAEELNTLNPDLKIIKNVVKSSHSNESLNEIRKKGLKLKDLNPLFIFEKRLKLVEDLTDEHKESLILAFKEILETSGELK